MAADVGPDAVRPRDDIVDVLIIGAGASGAAVAWSLAETRMRILCLEQGDWIKPGEFPANGRDWEARRYADFDIFANRRGRDTDYPINDDGSAIKIANFNGVGGGTIVYTAHYPRMHPSDFRVRTLDGVADDWPIDYWTLEPYFAETLREEIGPWLAAGEDRVLLSGMIGSRQGWREAPYVACPAGTAELAAALVDVPFDWGKVKLVPGLSATDEDGVAEVMRGEETQVIGVLAALNGNGIACLPGTHSKWVRVQGGRITDFATHMTGEVFAALRGHTILGRMMREGPPDGAAFDAGVRRSADAGGLLHHIFGVRALALADRLAETDAAAYLSGILLGHEVRSALRGATGVVVHVIGAPELTSLYARVISACGAYAERHDGEAAARGQALIAEQAAWG